MSSNTFTPTNQDVNAKEIEAHKAGSSIVVVGAGAFGGWTAWFLLQAGYKVTLIDCWGPGNSRSSSGDETRVIRSTYGGNEFYFDLNVRSLALWKEYETRWQKKFFQNKGVLWFCYDEASPIVDDSLPFAKKHSMLYQKLSTKELNEQYPQINTSDLTHAWLDPFGGCLRARESCQAVQKAFIAAGGKYIQDSVKPGNFNHDRMDDITLSNGNVVKADSYIFACGSWLGSLFPEVLSNVITCSKQEVYYLGVPEQSAQAFDNLPVWIDLDGTDFYYGIPGNSFRGFKIGVDKRGESFNPSNGNRTMNEAVYQKAMRFIAHRFPDLKNAPLIENRVCPYENSPDGNFLFDHHPEASNLFFLGGGSGHGFKHGPALGELIADIIKGNKHIPHHLLLRTL
jgi:glycine/D-amino acid oxidase-like deaminating enzyme